VSRDQVGEQLLALSRLLGPDCDVVPVSAVKGEQVDVLVEVIALEKCRRARPFIRTVNSPTSEETSWPS